MLEENEFLLRPANYHPSAPGRGSVLLDMGAVQVGIISLLGAAFMEPIANPFDAADREVHRLKEAGAHIILIDFHAEATAEKRALGYYLDGRVSALFGTHTHVQTADEQVLPGGTGYTYGPRGMTGPKQQVCLGSAPRQPLKKCAPACLCALPTRTDLACWRAACLILTKKPARPAAARALGGNHEQEEFCSFTGTGADRHPLLGVHQRHHRPKQRPPQRHKPPLLRTMTISN